MERKMDSDVKLPTKASSSKNGDNFLTRREGKRLIFESGLLLQCVSFACLFISFASGYWIISWPRVYSPFKRIGLWEACFAGWVLPFDPEQKAYHGCWWILAPEYSKIRGWLMPPWFVFTQVITTFCFVAEIINLFIMFFIWIRTGGTQKDGKYKDRDPLTLLQTGAGITTVTGIAMAVTVIVFGTCTYTDRQYLPNPYLNYLSWSYGLAVVSAMLSILSSMCQITYVSIVRHQMREPPRSVPLQGYLPAASRDTSI